MEAESLVKLRRDGVRDDADPCPETLTRHGAHLLGILAGSSWLLRWATRFGPIQLRGWNAAKSPAPAQAGPTRSGKLRRVQDHCRR
jgi:hypothetical protein